MNSNTFCCSCHWFVSGYVIKATHDDLVKVSSAVSIVTIDAKLAHKDALLTDSSEESVN